MAASITCWQRNSWLVLNQQFESQSNHTDNPQEIWRPTWRTNPMLKRRMEQPTAATKALEDSLGFGGIAASLVVVGVQSLYFYQKACLTCKSFLLCCLIFLINSLHCLPFGSVPCSDLKVKSAWKSTKVHSFISSPSIPKLAKVPKAS